MPDHEGLPVEGYRPQSDTTINLVNINKRMEEEILRVLDELKYKTIEAETNSGFDAVCDQRWLAIGRTHIEQGFMAINRAIFKPGRVRLPGD